MSFKNLNLDQSKIKEAIVKFSLDAEPAVTKKGNGDHFQIIKDGKVALVVFYFNKDGTTTIHPNVGKNTELSNEFAEFIKSECSLTNLNQGSISVPNIKDDVIGFLFDFLNEVGAVKTITLEEEEETKRYKLKSPYKDEVSLTHYNTKTLLVQGRPLYLFHEIKLFLYELLSFDQVVATESKTYKIDLKTDEVRRELKAVMPSAFDFLDEKIVKILTPSLSLRKLEIELEDYSCFAFPALRGLEGYMRQLLKAKGNTDTVRNINTIGKLFDNGPTAEYSLTDWAKNDIPCNHTCCALESSYNLFNSKRHPFFHVKSQVETTSIIWNKRDAESLIFEVFDTIEKSYSQIPLS